MPARAKYLHTETLGDIGQSGTNSPPSKKYMNLNKASNLAELLGKTELIKEFEIPEGGLAHFLTHNLTDPECKYIWAMIYQKNRDAIKEKLVISGLPIKK